MPTSTLQLLGLQSVNYTWDAVTGLLYSAGLLNFWILISIITGVICIAIAMLTGIFGLGKR